MTEQEKKMKQYTNAVERRLNLPRDVKVRVMADFISAIQSRRDAGMDDDAIYAELGTPKQAAAELNTQMADFAYKKSPWRWLCLALGIGCTIILLFRGVASLAAYLLTAVVNQGSIGIIGGADGPTAIFISQSPMDAAQSLIVTLVLLVMSILGFWYLSHLRKK